RRDDLSEYEQRLAQLRAEAVARVEDEGELAAVIDLAQSSKVPWSVGSALAVAVDERYVEELLPLLRSEDETELDLAANYFGQLFREHGWAWLRPFVDAHPDLVALQTARLLLVTHNYPAAWEEAGRRGVEVV